MTRKNILIPVLVWVFFSMSCGMGGLFGSADNNKPVPKAVKGVLDLRNWDFTHDGPIRLDGEWGFFWNSHLDPEQEFQPAAFITVPGTWNGYDINGNKIAGDGHATYTLAILLKGPQKDLGFKFPTISSAFAFFVNGRPLASVGRPGKTIETTAPSHHPRVTFYSGGENEIRILCHVSNFSHWEGGMWNSILLGTHAQASGIQEKKRNLCLFLLGIIITIALYHLGIFLIKPDDRASLFFSLFSLLIGLRVMATDDIFLVQLFPGISWNVFMRVLYITFYLCILCFILFTRSLFPEDVPERLVKAGKWTTTIFILIVTVTQPRFFTYTMPVFQALTIILFIYGILIYRRALMNKREGSFLYLAGFGVLIIAGTNDILYSRQIAGTGYSLSYGLFFFMITQTLLLLTRFSKAFNTIGRQRNELAETNTAYKKEIQDRLETEKKLRESEKRYRILAENVSDIIWTLDLKTFRFSYVSPSVYKMRGLAPDKIMEQDISEVFSHDGMESVIHMLAAELRRDGKPDVDPGRSKTLEFEQRNADGSFSRVEATMSFIRDDQGRPVEVLGVTRDIGERKRAEEEKQRLEEKLQQSKKLEAIATLAGGIAHQFNNALSTIIGRIELMKMELPAVNAGRHLLPVKDTAQQMAKLTNQLLAYARGGKYLAKSVSMSQFIRDAMPLALPVVKSSVHVQTDLSAEMSPVNMDEPQMQMVLSALLSNASEAIEHNGRICISCKETEIGEEEHGSFPEVKPGRYVRLTVTDNGRGMDEQTRNKIFDPFFTTKFQGRGLGMAAVYGIIKNHGGWIFVDSEPGKGSGVSIYLPVFRDKADDDPVESQRISELPEEKLGK